MTLNRPVIMVAIVMILTATTLLLLGITGQRMMLEAQKPVKTYDGTRLLQTGQDTRPANALKVFKCSR
jgi:hypothetical protein